MKNIKFRLGRAILHFWIQISSNEIDSKMFRRYISLYFYEDYNYEVITHFTDVRVLEEKFKFVVEITTHRPGILIGRQGSTVDGLKEWLNRGEFTKPVEVSIKESKMWLKLF